MDQDTLSSTLFSTLRKDMPPEMDLKALQDIFTIQILKSFWNIGMSEKFMVSISSLSQRIHGINFYDL